MRVATICEIQYLNTERQKPQYGQDFILDLVFHLLFFFSHMDTVP